MAPLASFNLEIDFFVAGARTGAKKKDISDVWDLDLDVILLCFYLSSGLARRMSSQRNESKKSSSNFDFGVKEIKTVMQKEAIRDDNG